MSMTNHAILVISVSVAIGIVGSETMATQSPARSTPYPTKPVRMIVPFAPGGGTDTVARVIGQKLMEIWPYPVVIDNRAGAGATIGTEITARAAADGYTVATISMTHAINVSLYRKLPYDPVADFSPVILAATTANILVIHPSVPARSVKELITLAKARPGQLNYPSSGVGGVSHLAAHMFSSVAGIDLVHVPYKGAGPSMTALLGGEVQLMMAITPVALPHIRSGRLVALAIASRQRSALVPNVPTIAELGFPSFEVDQWFGVVAPRRTPEAIVSQLNADIAGILQMEDTKEWFARAGAQPAGGSPRDFREYIESEIVKWGKVVKSTGMRPN